MGVLVAGTLEHLKWFCGCYEPFGYKFIMCPICHKIKEETPPPGPGSSGPCGHIMVYCQCKTSKANPFLKNSNYEDTKL